MEESLAGSKLELHDGKAVVWYNEYMERQNYPVRKTTLHEADDLDDEYCASLTPQECLAMVWPITQQVWKFAGRPFETRLRRDVVRIGRRKMK